MPPNRHLVAALVLACAAALSLLPVRDAYARPPICDGTAGACVWEVGYVPDVDAYYYLVDCPNGEGAFYIISALDALLACSS